MKVSIWNVCNAEEIETGLKLEKVLSTKNPYLPTGYIEAVFSTTDWDDIELLSKGCTSNLWLRGNTEKTLIDVCIVSGILWREAQNDWLFTVSAEWCV